MVSPNPSSHWLNRPLFKDPSRLFRPESLLVFLILVLAVLSRFVIVGERVMSHDEVNHVVPSYDLFQGRGYRHDPITHGPFQFHIVALSYFLFGANDTTSRVPAALFSIAAVVVVLFAFRRYLGRAGALIAGLLFVISPYMLFYGRYTRNEAFIQFLGVIMLYAILRYLETGERWAMFLLTFSVVMHITVKETSFIYIAQALVFLVFMFLIEVRRILHDRPERYNRFLLLLAVAMLAIILALAVAVVKVTPSMGGSAGSEPAATGLTTLQKIEEVILLTTAFATGLAALFSLAKDIGWNQIKALRSFSLLVLTGTLILPTLSPFPVSIIGWNPIDYTTQSSIAGTAAFVAVFFMIGIALGWWWNPRLWLLNALLFWSFFTVFYTTFFTNGFGFFTGIVGSLGYWLSQQGVERGTQPWYYYLFQVSIYEFLPFLGSLLALYFGIRLNRFSQPSGFAPSVPTLAEPDPVLAPSESSLPTGAAIYTSTLPSEDRGMMDSIEAIPGAAPDPYGQPPLPAHEDSFLDFIPTNDEPSPQIDALYARSQPVPVLGLLLFWTVTSFAAYTVAGEKMPWLTVHITLPMLLATGWGLGILVDHVDWKRLGTLAGLLALLLLPVVVASASGALSPLLAGPLPFQGNTLEQLRVTSRFTISILTLAASIAAVLYLLRHWNARQVAGLAGVTFFALLTVLTARAGYRASFINYDSATEYLVYAHAARGPKDVLAQVEEISRRTTGAPNNVRVAYSNDGLYPYWWYFRDFPNKFWYQDKPTRELREYPLIIAGEDVFGKIDSVVGANFTRYDYMRLWWPNQDYYNLTWERIWGAISNPEMRSAVFQIWLNRDYSEFARVTGKDTAFTPQDWSPGAKMRLYIRNDIVGQIWNYGASPVAISPEEMDPYAATIIQTQPVQVIGSTGTEPGQFNAPRGLEIAADGSIYVADSRNHRIQHLSPTGQVLHVWGSYADRSQGEAPGGTFYEPWDVALGPDGSVYVSDTWNHRVQKFTADGTFIKEWGYFGQGEAPDAFWGPRGLAVDRSGNVYVMDTGNDRVVVFDADGNYISQTGSQGMDPGQFDEPVDLAIDPASGDLYITDTWNARVQQLAPSTGAEFFTPVASWEVAGWAGQSLDNKPYIAISPTNGHLFITDPEGPRILEFDPSGKFLRGWGEYSTGSDGFGLASGVAVAQNGDVWVSDGANNFLLRFTLP